MNKKTSKDRRDFLKGTAIALSAGGLGLMLPNTLKADMMKSTSETDPDSYLKFLNPDANIGDLTESAHQMVPRDQLLQNVLKNIPTPERAEQVFNVILQHILAEEAGDVDATMATLAAEPVFENMPEGKTYQGHQSVADDYAARYSGLTRKLHITNVAVDSKGAFAEMLWEGKQVGVYKELKPVKNAKSFFVPMVVYYEVNSSGLIQRESVYYDQYLGALSIELIPDILHRKWQLIQLNPGLLLRKG